MRNHNAGKIIEGRQWSQGGKRQLGDWRAGQYDSKCKKILVSNPLVLEDSLVAPIHDFTNPSPAMKGL
jgi:hypothetical protein